MGKWINCDHEWINFDHLKRIWIKKLPNGCQYIIMTEEHDEDEEDRYELLDKIFESRKEAATYLHNFMKVNVVEK